MIKPLHTTTPSATLLSAWELMLAHDIRHLPVCDESGVVVGMLSDRDIQRAMIVDRTGGGDEEIFLAPGRTVAAFMRENLFLARGDTELSDVIDEMLLRKVSSIIIVGRGGRPVGIITSTDIMALCRDQILRSEDFIGRTLSVIFPNTLY